MSMEILHTLLLVYEISSLKKRVWSLAGGHACVTCALLENNSLNAASALSVLFKLNFTVNAFTPKAGGRAGGQIIDVGIASIFMGQVVKRRGSKSTERNNRQPTTSFALLNLWSDTIIGSHTKTDCDYTT